MWRALDTQLSRPAAVKLLHAHALAEADQLKRFEREARVTARIAHPHVVTVLDCGSAAGVPWIAYELLPGPSLRQVLEAGALPLAQALAAAHQVALALAASHAQGVLHRDVKPDNVLGAGPDAWKVADFGIASWAGDTAVRTATGVILGTPAYIAPEQVLGAPPSPQTDVYALGVMLYELVTGVAPFRAESPVDLLAQHVSTAPEPPSALRPDLPRRVDELVLRALAKRPEERFRDATAMAEALASALAGQAAAPAPSTSGVLRASARGVSRSAANASRTAAIGAAAPSVTLSVVAPPPRARSIAAALAALAVVAAGAFALSGAFRRPPPSPSAAPEPLEVRLRRFREAVRPLRAALHDAAQERRTQNAGSGDRAAGFAAVLGEARASELKAQLDARVAEAAALAPELLADPDVRASRMGFVIDACALGLAAHRLYPDGADVALTHHFEDWARRWRENPLARYPLFTTLRRAERVARADAMLDPEAFRELAGAAMPQLPRADDPVTADWIEFQGHLARFLAGLPPASRDDVLWKSARAVLRAAKLARAPQLAAPVESLVYLFDDMLLTRARRQTERRAMAVAGSPAVQDASEKAQHELEETCQERRGLLGGWPDGYDALVVVFVATELEARKGEKGCRRASELVDEICPKVWTGSSLYPWMKPLVEARRDALGFGVPMNRTLELATRGTALADLQLRLRDSCPVTQAPPASAERLRAHAWFWGQAMLWAADTANAVQSHTHASAAAANLQTGLKSLLEDPRLADEFHRAEDIIRQNHLREIPTESK